MISSARLETKIDNTPSITTDAKTGKLSVIVSGRTYFLKEDV